jgi:Uma2 family endonuclease
MTPEEYLRLDRADEWRSEYIDGRMFERHHPTARHVLIATNLASELHGRLRGAPGFAAMGAMRITTDAQRHYAYPDVVAVRDEPQFVDDQLDTLMNPGFIAEVLSDSTENDDRGAKFERYRAVPTLAEYMLVSQDRVHVELYTRSADGIWLLREWSDAAAEIELASLGCRLNVAEVYAKVTFEPSAS